MRKRRGVVTALTCSLAIYTFSTGFTVAQTAAHPTISELTQFVSKCGYVTKSNDNSGEERIIVVGEYHRFDDVQNDVECLMKEIVATYSGIEFLGIEGISYDDGVFYRSGQPKLNLGMPLIGIEDESYRKEHDRIAEIDDRHAELSRKQMDIGLTSEEYVEYQHVSHQSYELILRKRSWEWVDNINDFMVKYKMTFGLLNTGFGHFPTMAERFDQYGISYVFMMPNAANNYCTCEAYWQKKKPENTLSCKAACENPAVEPWWD